MKLGTIWLWGNSRADFEANMAMADGLGSDVIGIGDVPPGYHDPYLSLGLAAQHVRRATLGPMITAPQLRHPVANVTAMSALHELTDGRAILGLGAGDSIVFGLGRPQPKQDFIRDYIFTIRRMFAGEEVSWEGGTIKPMRYVHRVPVYYSAHGPKAMRVAGAAADGAILMIGQKIEEVRKSIAIVRDAAREAGRDPAEVTIWAHSFVSIADTRTEALRAISSLLAVKGPILAKQPNGMSLVPPHLASAMQDLQQRYDFRDHGLATGKNGPLAESLGLLEFLSGFNTIAGSDAEVAAYMKELEAEGVSLLLSPMTGRLDPGATMTRLKQAMP